MRKVNFSAGLSEADFPSLKCIPPEEFSLYNDPEKNLANSIGLLFEQCGGKNSAELADLAAGQQTPQDMAEDLQEVTEL